MLACLDADYREGKVVAACLLFDSWTAAQPVREIVVSVPATTDYVPGHFYQRELPALLAVLEKVDEPLTTVIVDGYVWLASGRPGLGWYLWDQRGRRDAVVGVAKNPFVANDVALPVVRGESSKPLFVTAIGTEVADAAAHVREMHGPYRVPTLLKGVDQSCRAAFGGL